MARLPIKFAKVRPSEVLDHQRRFLEAFQDRHTDPLQITLRYVMQVIDTIKEETLHDAPDDVRAEFNTEQLALSYCRRTEQDIKASYAFWAASDMLELVAHAGDQLPSITRIEADMFPKQQGFVLFEEPVVISREHVGGFLWSQGSLPLQGVPTAGVTVSLLVPNDMLLEALHRGMAESEKVGRKPVLFTAPGETKEQGNEYDYERMRIMYDISVRTFGRYEPKHFRFIPFDQRIGNNPCSDNVSRFLASYLIMMDQWVVDVSSERAERPFARRARRMGLPEQVNIVRLRRAKHHGTPLGETHVERHHRWYVTGHWRNQPYGPGRSLVKRIWISDHIKGPDGAPLLLTDKVYALVR